MILVTKWFGVFLCDGTKVVKKRLMPSDPDVIAEKLAAVQRGALLAEEEELAEGQKKLQVSERRQASLGRPVMFDSSFITPSQYGFSDELMRDVMIRLGKLRTSEPIPRDKGLVQAIRSLDDLNESSNLMNERLHEWYGLHFPELADHAHDRRYAELIREHGYRDGIISELGLQMESIGADMDREDMEAIQNLAGTLCSIYDERERTEEFVSSAVDGICPNMCALLGGPLSARLISLAGGLERLTTLPSSTVQLLGAEKAMFRHLRSGKRPPKHGVLYQHPDIHRSPYWQRGKIARALAGKALIAAKIDQYDGDFRGDVLAQEFQTRVEEIRTKYPEAPKRPANKGKKKRTPRRN